MKIKDSNKGGYLRVSHHNQIYYELLGNPRGKPVVFIHSGPGKGFTQSDASFFDKKVWKVIFFDQRGAGKSIPHGTLRWNTTPQLVRDMKKLLDFLKLDKVLLFGGSWGATLALAFAIGHPEMVSGMLLRSVFFGSKKDIKHYVAGGIKRYFPDAWERFISHVPTRYKLEPIAYYLKQARSENLETRKKYLYEFAIYKSSIFGLKRTHRPTKGDAGPIIEMYYLKNNCFLPENYILRNAKKISGIPLTMVHGKHDSISSPSNAYQLKKKIENAHLLIVSAGHSSNEQSMKFALTTELEKFSKV